MKSIKRLRTWAKKNIIYLVGPLLYPVVLLFDGLWLGGSVNEDGINERAVFVLFAAPVAIFIAVLLFAAFIKPLLRRK